MDKYIEVYSILFDLAELTKEEYYQLNSIYGSEVVSSVYDIVYDNYLSKEIKRMLENTLNERQLFVILNYFGFFGRCYSIPVIASMLGVTRQATDQLMKNALKKLKKKTNIMEFATD